jgi:DNA polymerase-3 subunit gamma/tau
MTDAPEQTPYRVLARKYRPGDFSGLIGQQALVRTLSNAIAGGRIAHAFMLTGVRGIGKTTTARIIARALNCVGPDGKGGETVEPCGKCEHCVSIAEDRHVDVIEVDAASHTGVDNIRDLTDGARYRPVSARYKIYIIDEVHMLSRGAFNALLKTLEEPPEHVKFIFATTEIRKVPVTVLSRCQRFDLRRVATEGLVEHFRTIAAAEDVPVEDAALAIIARAADGSVRDGLSLLDQAMALSGDGVTGSQVRDMLGLADRTQVFDLFESVMAGDIAGALDRLQAMYRDGADPIVVLQDLMELAYWLTRVTIVPEAADAASAPEAERERGRAMAATLSIPALTRAWQVLLKGLEEVQRAPAPLQAAEMVLVRLAYMAELPSPADLARELHEGKTAADGAAARPAAQAPGNSGKATATRGAGAAVAAESRPEPSDLTLRDGPPVSRLADAADQRLLDAAALLRVREQVAEPHAEEAPGLRAQSVEPHAEEAATAAVSKYEVAPQPQASADILPAPQSFTELAALFERNREAVLHTHLCRNVHLVHFEPGRLEFRPGEHAPRDLANRIGSHLSEWTGQRWVVSVSRDEGAPTLAEQAEQTQLREREEAARHPLVQAAQKAFPGAKITRVRASPRAGLDRDDTAPDEGGEEDESDAGED